MVSSVTAKPVNTYLDGEIVPPAAGSITNGSVTRGSVTRGSVTRHAVAQYLDDEPLPSQSGSAIRRSFTEPPVGIGMNDEIILVDDAASGGHQPSILSQNRLPASHLRVPGGSPSGSRISQRSRGSATSDIHRIVSIPFPAARASEPQSDVPKPDERDVIIHELRANVSVLERKNQALRNENSAVKQTNKKLQDEIQGMAKEIATLKRQLDEERAQISVTLSIKEAERMEAYELLDAQRQLLVRKDEEIRQLAQLAAAHKEQLFILRSQIDPVELRSIFSEGFDPQRVDVNTLDPDTRERVLQIIKAPTLEGHFTASTVTKKAPLVVGDRRVAAAVDAADGVIDGKFQGRAIVVASGGKKKAGGTDMSHLKKQLANARQERQRLAGKWN